MTVRVPVGVAGGVSVIVLVGVAVPVGLGDCVGVGVAVLVGVGVSVLVGVGVTVLVGKLSESVNAMYTALATLFTQSAGWLTSALTALGLSI